MSIAQPTPKQKKYYSINEPIWIKVLNRNGVVKNLDIKNKVATITYNSDVGITVDGEFFFWDIDKSHDSGSPISKITPNNNIKNNDYPTIKVKYLTNFGDGFEEMREISIGNWIDLSSSEDITLKTGEHKLIPLGFAMQLPEGHEAWIVPRSSTMKYYGIIQANHLGIVDNVYCGDNDQWYMSAIAMRDTVIPRGSRVCQFRIMPIMGKVNLVTVDHLGNPDRHGFGSTGK